MQLAACHVRKFRWNPPLSSLPRPLQASPVCEALQFIHWHGGQVAEVPALICMGQQCAQLLATIRHRPCVRAKSWCVGEGGKTCKTWHFYGVVLCEIQGRKEENRKKEDLNKNMIKETRKGTKKEEKTVTNEMKKNPYFTCYKFTLKTKIIEVPYCSIQLPPDCGNFPVEK